MGTHVSGPLNGTTQTTTPPTHPPTHLQHALKQVALPPAEAAPVGQDEQRQALRESGGLREQQQISRV